MNNSVKRKTLSKKVIAIICTIVLIILLPISWFAYNALSPKPLGDKLEYIGKRDYGCITFCDSKPGSTYYYATDTYTTEIEQYFKNAAFIEGKPGSFGTDEGPRYSLKFKSSTNDKTFYLTFYENGATNSKKYGVDEIKRKYLIEIDKDYYDIALKSL